MNAQPPSPEKLASWEAQALALLSTRTPPEKVVAHLKYVGCPLSLAQEIVARSRPRAKRQLRGKGLGILIGGVALLAACVLTIISVYLMGVPVPLLGRYVLLGIIAGIGMVIYGGLQILFG